MSKVTCATPTAAATTLNLPAGTLKGCGRKCFGKLALNFNVTFLIGIQANLQMFGNMETFHPSQSELLFWKH